MKITCAFQYELYVDETRRAALSRNAGCRRFVFNQALGIQNERKSKGEKLLTYKELAHELVLWKKQPETAFLREAMAQPLQQALLDLDRAISDSFRPKSDPAHKGWPKFKAKDIGDGFRVPQFAPEHIDDANGECQDFCVWGGYSRGSPTRLPFVFEMQYARPDAIAGAKEDPPALRAGPSTLAPAIARREAAGALAREV